ncbi:hypothetical protein C8R44DRAFT_741888 [Mycena epipterygia]|nr:hypothetical protein C8R44DRAFT_741888 [Mycena epipterygia]
MRSVQKIIAAAVVLATFPFANAGVVVVAIRKQPPSREVPSLSSSLARLAPVGLVAPDSALLAPRAISLPQVVAKVVVLGSAVKLSFTEYEHSVSEVYTEDTGITYDRDTGGGGGRIEAAPAQAPASGPVQASASGISQASGSLVQASASGTVQASGNLVKAAASGPAQASTSAIGSSVPENVAGIHCLEFLPGSSASGATFASTSRFASPTAIFVV